MSVEVSTDKVAGICVTVGLSVRFSEKMMNQVSVGREGKQKTFEKSIELFQKAGVDIYVYEEAEITRLVHSEVSKQCTALHCTALHCTAKRRREGKKMEICKESRKAQ